MYRTTMYRLLKRVQHEGEQTFADGRHGHPIKLRGGDMTQPEIHVDWTFNGLWPYQPRYISTPDGRCAYVDEGG